MSTSSNWRWPCRASPLRPRPLWPPRTSRPTALAAFGGGAPTDPAALIAEARQEITKALTQYAGGDTDAAYETAAGAYLNYFEALEGPLGKKDQALVDELEGQFKDLRDGIKAGKAQADLQVIADKINAGLDKAQQLLRESN
jgi:hypothetical protein